MRVELIVRLRDLTGVSETQMTIGFQGNGVGGLGVWVYDSTSR
jgi:hypothetical protein